MGIVCDAGITTDDFLCWRYFRVGRLVELLADEQLYFASANQFSDPFEGAVRISQEGPPARNNGHFEKAFERLRYLTKINCWHIATTENSGMWDIYGSRGKGVAITTTLAKMKHAFLPYRLLPHYSEEAIYAGLVNYCDFSTGVADREMLGRFFCKDVVFGWENELRLAVSLRMAEEFGCNIPEQGIFVQVNVPVLIEQIVIGPQLEAMAIDQIYAAASRFGIEDRIVQSRLSWKVHFAE